MLDKFGGRGGIRTHGGVAPTAVFKTAALNHSATLPSCCGAFRLVGPEALSAPISNGSPVYGRPQGSVNLRCCVLLHARQHVGVSEPFPVALPSGMALERIEPTRGE